MPFPIPTSQNFEEAFKEDALTAVRTLLLKLHEQGFNSHELEIDHVCCRTSSIEKYEILKKKVEPFTDLLSEAYINGRPIASYKFKNPLRVSATQIIPVLEIPAPKNGQICADEFEHFEVVISNSLEDFMAQNSKHSFHTSNFSATVNRDISLSFGKKLVKFHEDTLENVIALEQAALARKKARHVVVLDLDDTLLPSGQLFLKAMHAALQVFLEKLIPFEDVVSKACSTFPDFLLNFRISKKEEIENFLKVFAVQWEQGECHCNPCVGIASVVSCLFYEGFELYIWTARDFETTHALLKKSGLAPFVKDVFAFDGADAGKPVPPTKLIEIVNQAEFACLVGDSTSDCEGAAKLNIPFLQAAWVHAPKIISLHSNSQVCAQPISLLNAIMELKKSSVFKISE